MCAGEGAGVAAAEASLWKALAGSEASLAPPLCWFDEDTCLFCTVRTSLPHRPYYSRWPPTQSHASLRRGLPNPGGPAQV